MEVSRPGRNGGDEQKMRMPCLKPAVVNADKTKSWPCGADHSHFF